jgi:hypothetical protein
MYIADTNNNRFQRWTKGAKTGVTIAGDPNSMPGTDATKFQGESAVAINANETPMYVTDTFNSRIEFFNLI